MLNIELHGFLGVDGNERETTFTQDLIAAGRKIEEVSELIEKALTGASYDAETLLTTCLSTCGRTTVDPSTPFLRIWATNKQERDDLVRRLIPLDIRIELAPLLERVIKPRSSVYKQTGRILGAAYPKNLPAQDKPIFKDRIE